VLNDKDVVVITTVDYPLLGLVAGTPYDVIVNETHKDNYVMVRNRHNSLVFLSEECEYIIKPKN
jgi:hypothetical protein